MKYFTNPTALRGSFHTTTTVTIGQKVEDDCHCTISLNPGHWVVHIYINLHVGTGMPLEDIKMIGESVVLRRKMMPHPTWSVGKYPMRTISRFSRFDDEEAVPNTVTSTKGECDTGLESQDGTSATT